MFRLNTASIGLLLFAVVIPLSTGCCQSCHRWQPKLNKWHPRSFAIPETLPLGSIVRSHYHSMQENGEAADFILHRHEFMRGTAELTPDGKDHLLEIAARMRSAPFPVIVERSEYNVHPELDLHRRNLIAQILYDFGNPDAHQRTFVAPAYGRALNAVEGEADYYRFISTRGFNGLGQFGNNYGQFSGFGGGAGGAFGFGQ